MTYLEILLLLLGIILPFLLSSKKQPSSYKILWVFIVGVFIAHAVMDGLRWQTTPIYLINIILILCLSSNYVYFKGNWFRKIVSGFFLFLMIALGVSFSSILPIFELPNPSGSYEIGSEYLHFISEEEETITDDLADKRELMIKVWYPAKVTDEAREVYLNEADREGFALKYGLPKQTFAYLDKVETHTFTSPAMAEGKFPILIFSHGYNSQATGYYALIEEIVSHGYIVFNINHTYESVGTLFPSGAIKFYDSEYDAKHNNEEMGVMIWEAMEAFKKATSKDEKRAAIQSSLKNYVAAEINTRWAKDIDMVVNQIERWEQSSFLSNHIDTSKIGVFGHSQGGGAAAQALLDNSKIRAGINVDGTQWGNMIDTFLSKPFLLLSSDWDEEHPNFNEFAYQNTSLSDFYLAKLKNSGHSNFMDIPFFIDLSAVNEAGSIEPKKAIEISSKTIRLFFDKYLKMENIDLLELSEQYPDLEMRKK